MYLATESTTLPILPPPIQSRARPRAQAQNPNQDLPESQTSLHSSTSTSATALAAAALSDLQVRLHDMQTSLASHMDKMRAPEGVLRVLVEKTMAAGGGGGDGEDKDDARSVSTIMLHELHRVKEDEE